jgi:hypothetical protein
LWPAHLNVDIFVFATSSVSLVGLWLLMAEIFLVNELKIERQIRIAVRLIITRTLISAAMQFCRQLWISASDVDLFLGVVQEFALTGF